MRLWKRVDIMPMETDTIEFNANADGDFFFVFCITWWQEWIEYLVMKIWPNPLYQTKKKNYNQRVTDCILWPKMILLPGMTLMLKMHVEFWYGMAFRIQWWPGYESETHIDIEETNG
jgi:hypothetical protein